MNQSTDNGKHVPKDHDDHHDEGNPMPDTHHVNPKSDDDKSRQKTGGGGKK
ncbi:MAG: hypothetical protein JJT87_01530 [Halomonas sp.]|nr:hypothetical protein [Halomonas sp.]MCC5900594.1 hypothetical protein [Halomonas sp.]